MKLWVASTRKAGARVVKLVDEKFGYYTLGGVGDSTRDQNCRVAVARWNRENEFRFAGGGMARGGESAATADCEERARTGVGAKFRRDDGDEPRELWVARRGEVRNFFGGRRQ